jgi:hypothetical protein
LELPGNPAVRDWFVPFKAEPVHGRLVWLVSDMDEPTAYEHLGELCSLGIPSFLSEQFRRSCMKLFMPLELYVNHNRLQTTDEEDREDFWFELRQNFVRWTVEVMAEAVAQMFTVSESMSI